MPVLYRISLLGFSEFEHQSLASCFRLAASRTPTYELAPQLTDADFLVVNADHAPSVQLVVATERTGDSVFIGDQVPPGATAWTMRPIDPLHVMRELDALVAAAESGAPRRVATLHDVAIDLAPPPPALAEASRRPASKQAPGDFHALLIDDSPIALRFLQTRLERRGLRTTLAGSSRRALELLTRRRFDLIFLDVELGEGSELDGLALCQKIKRQASRAAPMVIIVSAHHSELDRVRGALAGCDAYLAKPLDEVELDRLLRRQGVDLSHELSPLGPVSAMGGLG